ISKVIESEVLPMNPVPVTAETALRNEIASAEMEGYRFEPEEIELVKACLGGEITYQTFLERVLRQPGVCQ
ncbi:MAG: antitoxin VbhA family protein, partial [Oscillospiraceae bacterium]|nr:antitoxin VbhA family protein [Oscillospiraceae bacterium]